MSDNKKLFLVLLCVLFGVLIWASIDINLSKKGEVVVVSKTAYQDGQYTYTWQVTLQWTGNEGTTIYLNGHPKQVSGKQVFTVVCSYANTILITWDGGYIVVP